MAVGPSLPPKEEAAKPRAAPHSAILLAVIACAFFAGANAIGKDIGVESPTPLHPFQITFFRFLFGSIALSPFLWLNGFSLLRSRQLHLQALRAFCGVASATLMFLALQTLPLSGTTALAFTSPIFALAFALIFLGEKVGRPLWLAAFVGFAGVLSITQPTSAAFQIGSIFALSAAAAIGFEIILGKFLTREDSYLRIALVGNGLAMLIAFVPALFVWRDPTPWQWGMLVLLGPVGAYGQLLFVKALGLADAHIVSPFLYMTLVFAALYGVLLFGEALPLSTIAGGLLIAAAGIYANHHAQRAK